MKKITLLYKKILCAALSIVLLFGMMLALSSCGEDEAFDYLAEDLTKYITLSKEAYQNFNVSVKLDGVTESDVSDRINKILVSYKNTTAMGSGAADRSSAIGVGDKVTIFYRGYTLDENNEKIEFDGGCNITSTAGTLEIGSGSFIPGFESSLIGVIPEQYSKLEKTTKGTIEAGDTVYLKMTAILPDGTSYQNKVVKVDLSDPRLEEKWGVGFGEKIIGGEIGSYLGSFTTELKTDTAAKTASYSSVSIQFKTTGEENPFTLKAYFPMSYGVASLAGKEVYFDVYISGTVHYETPSLTESFITDTLKLTADMLAEYQGDTLIEKYKSSVREELAEEYQASYNALLEEGIWSYLYQATEVKKLPENAVEELNTLYLAQFEEEYAMYESYGYYTSIEDFAADYFGLSDGTVYKDVIRSQAEDAVKEKLILYYIMRTENLYPSADELASRKEAEISEMLAYYVEDVYADEYDRAKYDSDEAYEKAISDFRTEMIAYYGEIYFEESAIYSIAFETIFTYPKVKLIGRGHS